MYVRNRSVPDFVRHIVVSCPKMSEAYADEIRAQLAENQPQRQVLENSGSASYMLGG